MEKELKAPKLRFPGFTDDWEQRKLDDWGTFYYGKSCPKWSIEDGAPTPCIRYGEMYTKFGNKIDRVYSYTNITAENLRFSTGKEVLIPRVGEDPLDYNHCTWLSLKDVAIGEMISVFNTDQDPLFSATMFNATLKYEFAKRVEGGSVTNLYFEKLKNIQVSYPSMQEQKKIASFFEKLDNLITLHQRKLDTLKKLKKGFLQKMFPKNGESVPEIRFPGFTDAWEQRKLGNIANFINGRAYSQSELQDSGKYKILRVGNFYTNDSWYYSDMELDEKFYANKGDLLYTWSATFGPHIWDGDKVIYHYHIWKIELANSIDKTFAIQLLEKDKANILSNTNGSTMIHITKAGMEEKIVTIPAQIEEQMKIGSFLDKLDNLITLHQRKLDTLKKFKQGMLQQMFI